jgi:hypothetical protein
MSPRREAASRFTGAIVRTSHASRCYGLTSWWRLPGVNRVDSAVPLQEWSEKQTRIEPNKYLNPVAVRSQERFELCVLNYACHLKPIHLLVKNTGGDVISRSMQINAPLKKFIEVLRHSVTTEN